MFMWDSVPVKSFVVSVLHFQIGLGGVVLINVIGFFGSGVEKLSTGD